MSEAAVRAMIKSVLDGIPGVGATFDYVRHWTTQAEFDAACRVTIGQQPQYRWWFVTCERIESAPSYFGIGHNDTLYTYVLRGYLALNDATASEKTMVALAETVRAALDTSTSIHGEFVTGSRYEADNALIRTIGHVAFSAGSYTLLCNYVEIEQRVRERPSFEED